jgi:hypothetical protein
VSFILLLNFRGLLFCFFLSGADLLRLSKRLWKDRLQRLEMRDARFFLFLFLFFFFFERSTKESFDFFSYCSQRIG